MASSKSIQQHYLRILRLWPKDPLRSLTFHDAMRRRLAAKFPPASSSSSSSQPDTKTTAHAAVDNGQDLSQINALYSLLEDRFAKQYPASDTLMRPASDPTYYEALAAEMDAAPRRSWLANKWLRLSKLVRFS